MSSLGTNVLAARERLAKGHDEFRRQHRDGCSAVELCAAMTDLRDAVVRDLCTEALADLDEAGAGGLLAEVALVAHGGYGRRDMAPYSDVDLMILHAPRAAARTARLAERLLRDVFDASMVFGHSVRTPEQAAALAAEDPVIATSLIESRRLLGSEQVYLRFTQQFRRLVRRRSGALVAGILRARREEQGDDTVFLVEPNIKRSRGSLRDLHLLRWIGFARYGTPEPQELQAMGAIGREDLDAVERAREFLLRLRNEMHFHAGKPVDVLDRSEQLRIADEFGYRASAGMLPVERLMRDYFRHTQQLGHVTARLVANARSQGRLTRVVTAVFGHHADHHLRVGPMGILATARGLEQARGSFTAILRMADLSNLYNKPIAPETWEAVRRDASRLPDEPDAEACRHFLSLLGHPGRLGTLLRDLRDAGVLERLLPVLAHARGLLPFNEYHKYTIDEHCLRAVDFATRLLFDMGPCGRAYREIPDKRMLHLGLLLHDLGKGFPEDHCEVGRRIAEQTARRLSLAESDTEMLTFLVHKHLLMNHLAFHRDTSDEQLIVQFAREVGSPERLRMLLVLTASDLAAVGPGVWDRWKADILADFYERTMRSLAGGGSAAARQERLARRRDRIASLLGTDKDHPWFRRQLEALPADYVNAAEPERIVADLRLLHHLPPAAACAEGRYLPETDTVQLTVATREDAAEGIFHRLTGAVTSRGLAIRSAEINTLCDGLVLDRFWVGDPDFAGEPPRERIHQIETALTGSLAAPVEKSPAFRRVRRIGRARQRPPASRPARVTADNSTSDRYTILDVFARDRTGLLYEVARALFELGLSVGRARIATYEDDVVDVFYVTDRQGGKIEDWPRLQEIRRRILAVADSSAERKDQFGCPGHNSL